MDPPRHIRERQFTDSNAGNTLRTGTGAASGKRASTGKGTRAGLGFMLAKICLRASGILPDSMILLNESKLTRALSGRSWGSSEEL